MKAGTHSVHLKWMTDEDKLLAGVELHQHVVSPFVLVVLGFCLFVFVC